MDYDFSDELLEKAFSAVEDYAYVPIQEHEFTAADMAKKYPRYGKRNWRKILNRAAQDGVLEKRKAKGGANAYSVVDGEEFDIDD